MVRAKFVCIGKEPMDGGEKIMLEAVTHGSAENDKFFRYTPCGRVEIGTINEKAAQQFILGNEYFVDFTSDKK